MIEPEKPILYIDTREQLPLFKHRHRERFSHIVRATIPAGDYTFEGQEGNYAFERKSLNDLIQTLTAKNRDRFIRELERAQHYKHFSIVIEDTFKNVSGPYTHSKMNPQSIIGSLQAFQIRYGVEVVYAGNRKNAEDFILAKIEQVFYGKA